MRAMPRTVGVVTVARSDYGHLVPVLQEIQAVPDLELGVYVAGSHLATRFGRTVTAVETTPDLRTARVHVSILGDEAEGRVAMAALERATRHLRKVIGERTELRYVPELVFIEDRSAERAARISSLLREAREREGRHDG